MSDGKVELFPSPDEMFTPQMALIEADKADLTTVLVLGYTQEGRFYSTSSGGVSRADALWLVEHARMQTLGIGPFAEDADA